MSHRIVPEASWKILIFLLAWRGVSQGDEGLCALHVFVYDIFLHEKAISASFFFPSFPKTDVEDAERFVSADLLLHFFSEIPLMPFIIYFCRDCGVGTPVHSFS